MFDMDQDLFYHRLDYALSLYLILMDLTHQVLSKMFLKMMFYKDIKNYSII